MAKTISVNLDDIKVDISLDKIIEKEVEKRLKDRKPEFTIHIPGRRQGNTYRALLKAQLLASGEPNQNVFFTTYSTNYAEHLSKMMAEGMRALGINFRFSYASRHITLENGSRIFFTTRNSLYNRSSDAGLQNVHYVSDNY